MLLAFLKAEIKLCEKEIEKNLSWVACGKKSVQSKTGKHLPRMYLNLCFPSELHLIIISFSLQNITKQKTTKDCKTF